MAEKKSYEALLEFLDYVSKKGLLNQKTAEARKTSVLAVFSVLDSEEKLDVTSVDLQSAMKRFHNLQGSRYSPDSLRTYQSRVRSAVNDFARYTENPLAFKPTTQTRERRSTQSKTTEQPEDFSRPPSSSISEAPKMPAVPLGSTILPIPLRADLTVFIQGLPFDLTGAEAKKIAAVVQAMAFQE